MLLASLLLIAGLLLLVYGADRLVYGAAAIANCFGIPPMLIGMTIVSVGTSLPELSVALTATMHNQFDTAIGTAVGSNIANILLILGVTALIQPLSVHSNILRCELPLMLIVTILSGFLLYGNQLTRIDGVILLLSSVGFLWLMLKIAGQAMYSGNDPLTTEQITELPRDTSNTVALLWIAVGLIILPLAAQMVTDNTIIIARYLGVSELVISLTLLAVGTSLPELATSIAGALKNEHDIVLGNIIGSNSFNLLIVLGLPALISPENTAFDVHIMHRDYWVMLGASLLLAALCMRKKLRIGQASGALLVLGFLIYVAVLFHQSTR